MTLIHQNASEKAREFFTTYVFVLWFCVIAIDPFPTLAYLPKSIVQPSGFLLLILPEHIQTSIYNITFLYGFKFVTLAVLLCVIFRKYFLPAALLACLLLTLHQGIVRPIPHIRHTGVILLYAAYFFTFFSFADSWAKNTRDYNREGEGVNLNSIPFVLILAVFCFTYTFVGAYRMAHSGFAVFSSESMTHWVVSNSHKPHTFHWQLEGVYLQNKWIRDLFRIGFPIGTFFEIFAPLCLISRWFRYAFLCVIIPFHIIIFLFMDILFWYTLAIYILFFDFTPLFSKANKFSTAS